MKSKSGQSGVTLTEMAVVVGVVAVLVAIGLPAIRAFRGAFESGGSVKGLISAGLASARAIAAREQRYASIRFQQDLSRTHQYMIFIIHDPTLVDEYGHTVPLSGFRAVEGLEPVRLPETIGVMEAAEYFEFFEGEGAVENMTTFSVVFSPAGRLVVRDVRVLRRHSNDAVFNIPSTIPPPMFAQDNQAEPSRNRLTIYDRNLFNKLNMEQMSEYLQSLETIYINPYTGTMINQ